MYLDTPITADDEKKEEEEKKQFESDLLSLFPSLPLLDPATYVTSQAPNEAIYSYF